MKNKYGNFVIQKAVKTMPLEEKLIIKYDLTKKIDIISVKEKARLFKLIESL